MTRLDLLGALGSLVSPVANWAIGQPADAMADGEDAGHRPGPQAAAVRLAELPAPGRPPPADQAHARAAGSKVVYFVDTYANYHDPQLAEALVAVLEHNGVAVYVPPRAEAGRHGGRSPAGRSTTPGGWPGTTSPSWPKRSARATTSWPPSRPPPSA